MKEQLEIGEGLEDEELGKVPENILNATEPPTSHHDDEDPSVSSQQNSRDGGIELDDNGVVEPDQKNDERLAALSTREKLMDESIHTILPVHYMVTPASTFSRFMLSVIVVQALVAIGSSWYSWHIQNLNVAYSFLLIFQLWFGEVCWLASIPYFDETKIFLRTSFVIFILSMNPYLQDTDIALVIPLNVMCFASILVAAECAAKCLAKEYGSSDSQSQLNRTVVALLTTAFKASLVVVYLQAEAFSGLQDSLQAQRDSMDIVLTENATIPLQDKLEAEIVFNNYQAMERAVVSGGALNSFFFLSVVLIRIAYISLEDIMSLRITISEGVLMLFTATLLVAVLVVVGVPIRITSANTVSGMFLLVGINVCNWRICRTILTGTHPYHQRRLFGNTGHESISTILSEGF